MQASGQVPLQVSIGAKRCSHLGARKYRACLDQSAGVIVPGIPGSSRPLDASTLGSVKTGGTGATSAASPHMVDR